MIVGTLNAMAFDAVPTTVSWAVGNESAATSVTEAVAGAVQQTKVTVGTDLSVSTFAANATLGTGDMPLYVPGTSNAGAVPTDMIEYTVKMKKGIIFTPTSVQFDAVKKGTDGAYFSWSYTVDGVESEIIAYSDPNTQIRRDNNANSTAPVTHDEAISGADGGRTFTLRFYISNVANNKSMAIGNIKINGTVSGEEEVRNFTNFKIDFTKSWASASTITKGETYYVTAETDGVPTTQTEAPGSYLATFKGDYHSATYGLKPKYEVTFNVDGPVMISIGTSDYGNDVVVKDANGNTITSGSAQGNKYANDGSTMSLIYNKEEAATLTVTSTNGYLPYIAAEACEYIAECTVTYFGVDGKTLIGQEVVGGSTPLKYAYGASDVTVPEGSAFRGWFNSVQSSAVKIAEGTSVDEDLKLYAKVTEIENPTNTSRYDYDMTKANWYIEDHEAIEMPGGSFHDPQHGWTAGADGVFLKVAGKALVTIKNCTYTNTQTAKVVDGSNNEIATFDIVRNGTEGQTPTPDGEAFTFKYDGPATTLNIQFPGGGAYVHGITVYNVKEFVEYDEANGYYPIPADDANSFLLALSQANATGNTKLFLPNGTYDLGDLCLTPISGNNISIIGESMEGTIIKNAPLVENEGIGTTATLLNTSDGLYLQDLTIQNALDYYSSGSAGRAVCLQDKGKNTICKNVKMLSYQDTYYSNAPSNRYWEDSEIHGTVDYLCGDGNVIYKRCKFVNESRARNSASGSDVLCAPNCTASTAERPNYGYIFLDCEIESKCKDFTLARSWGGESKAYFINTKVLDNSLASSRFTAKIMNNFPADFKEYNTTGSSPTPTSNVVKFYEGDEKTPTAVLEMETVMSATDAANYTIEKVFGEWAPESQTAQAAAPSAKIENNVITITPANGGDAGVYLIEKDGEFLALTNETTYNVNEQAEEGNKVTANPVYTVRASNAKGGFGEAAIATDPTAVEIVEAAPEAKAAEGAFVIGDKVVIIKDGKQFTAAGARIK